MSYSTIMVHLESDGQVDVTGKFAAGLADRFHAELIGINAWMPRPRPIVDPDVSAREFEHLKAATLSLGEKFRQKMSADGRKVDCRTFLEFPTECIVREARAADLLVIAREFAVNDPYLYPDPAAIVLKAGRPVLVVPPGTAALAARRAIVAWKDTREARRAVSDALPFLHIADEVIVTEICELDADIAVSQRRLRDVVQYLSRHGVPCVVDRVRSVEGGTAVVSLLNLVQDSSADLVVAGAYGHSRLGEWMFGGVTQGLLEQSPVCLLLSH
jgi:nucleotide-binding universal stress UspA family protein